MTKEFNILLGEKVKVTIGEVDTYLRFATSKDLKFSEVLNTIKKIDMRENILRNLIHRMDKDSIKKLRKKYGRFFESNLSLLDRLIPFKSIDIVYDAILRTQGSSSEEELKRQKEVANSIKK